MDRNKIAHYIIESELGRGGMGIVYKCFDPVLERHIAVKAISQNVIDLHNET